MSDSPEPTNDQRALWAERAIRGVMRDTQTDHDDALCDLLVNLQHWAAANGFDFDAELDRSRRHYAAEVATKEVPKI